MEPGTKRQKKSQDNQGDRIASDIQAHGFLYLNRRMEVNMIPKPCGPLVPAKTTVGLAKA